MAKRETGRQMDHMPGTGKTKQKERQSRRGPSFLPTPLILPAVTPSDVKGGKRPSSGITVSA